MSIFIKELFLENVRGLQNITIPICDKTMRHLILTGKNGSGKTSVLEAVKSYLHAVATDRNIFNYETWIEGWQYNLKQSNTLTETQCYEHEQNILVYTKTLTTAKQGIDFTLSQEKETLRPKFETGDFILAYYKAERIFTSEVAKHIEKVTFNSHYAIEASPRTQFVKFLADLKVTEALSLTGGKAEKAAEIKTWFQSFEALLRRIFDDNSLSLEFQEDTYAFQIKTDSKPDFDFNTLSSGYAAILDIIVDLLMRMQSKVQRKFVFDIPGIVLIDEIETHLHLDLQKQILPFLTEMFPAIQFILTTHSPFILNSIENVTIYDLEKNILVENGLTDVPYEGIVESYFKVNTLSAELHATFTAYKDLTQKAEITDNDLAEIERLENMLDEIPDFLAWKAATEYQRLKLEFTQREDV